MNWLKKNSLLLFGAIFGLGVFFYFCGWPILNPANSDWILAVGPDVSSHFLGWLFYLHSDWQWLPTLFDGASYPFLMPVGNCDSMPLYALCFKCIRFWLPPDFQYFGLILLFNFMVQGVVTGYLFQAAVKNRLLGGGAVILLVLSPIMLMRMPGHVTLSSHWILLLALTVWFRPLAVWKQWGITVLALLLNPYLWLMTFLLIVGNQIRETIDGPQWRKNLCRRLGIGAAVTLAIMLFGGFGITALDNSVASSGTCQINLNQFINPIFEQCSNLIRPLPLFHVMQMDGFAYLGGGIILGILLILPKIFAYAGNADWRHRHRVLLLTALFFVILAVWNKFTLGGHLLLVIDMPETIARFFTVFRANGRLIWPVWYLIVIALFIILDRSYGRNVQSLILAVVLAVQLYDFGGGYNGLFNLKWNEFRTLAQTHPTLTQSAFWEQQIIGKRHVFLADPAWAVQKKQLPLIRFLAAHGMTVNTFQHCRAYPSCQKYFEQVKLGKLELEPDFLMLPTAAAKTEKQKP